MVADGSESRLRRTQCAWQMLATLAKLEPQSSRLVLACEEELGSGIQVIRVGGVELLSLFSSSC